MATTVSTAVLVRSEDGEMPLRGRWQNSLCGCCNHGCNSYCPSGLAFCSIFSTNLAMLTCIPCLVGQIAARSSWRPNFCGVHQGGDTAASNGCTRAWLRLFSITAIPSAFSVFVYYMANAFHHCWFAYGLRSSAVIVCITFAIFGLCFLTNLRHYIRQRYDIPADCCCDCCVVFSCLPCVIAQMYTHVYSTKTDCNICSDPGPHSSTPSVVDLTDGYEKTQLMRMDGDSSKVVMAVAVAPTQISTSTVPMLAVVTMPEDVKNEQK